MLDAEGGARKRLHDANRVLREQALDPKTKVGPNFPAAAEPKRTAPESAGQPEAKRPKITEVLPPAPSQPSRPPPGFSGFAGNDANESNLDPFASAATGTVGANTESPSNAAQPSQSEADFLASLPRPEVTLQVRVPNDQAQMAWNFYGQIVSLSMNAMSTVKTVKKELSRQHLNDMPPNKIQLKYVPTGAFLKDSMTLAALNIGPTGTLELVPKVRGGRK